MGKAYMKNGEISLGLLVLSGYKTRGVDMVVLVGLVVVHTVVVGSYARPFNPDL
jgi:hypothetical protein